MEKPELPTPYGGRNDRCYSFHADRSVSLQPPKLSENLIQPYNGSDRGLPNLENGKPSLESSL
jgi:hypothetical protein